MNTGFTSKEIFSERFKALLSSRTNLLPGYSWTDGGCWTLAQALSLWSQGDIAIHGVWLKEKGFPPLVYHVVGSPQASKVYLDADGILSAKELLTLSKADMKARVELWLAPVADKIIERDGSIPMLFDVAQELSVKISEAFGPYQVGLFSSF